MQARSEARPLGGTRLRHSSPGTVSLAVAENDDDARLKGGRNYRNAEFLVTTGAPRPPAPMRQGAAPAARSQSSLSSAGGDTGTFEQRGLAGIADLRLWPAACNRARRGRSRARRRCGPT